MTKIQIVEDEGITAQGIKTMVRELGYTVTAVVSSGKEAVKKAVEMQPDLVLMDIVLEGDINGIEAAEQIRTRLNIPVIYLTAHADSHTLEQAKLTEPYGYIVKPFEVENLKATIEMALYRHQLEQKSVSSSETSELDFALKELVETEGVNAAAVISKDGLLVRFFNTLKPEDASPLSSVVAMMTKAAEKCARLLENGDIIEIITHTERGVIVIEKIGEFIILIEAKKSVDLDSLKPKRAKVRAAIWRTV